MIVLGIDPGLANLGLGLVDGDIRRARHLYHVCLTTESAWIMPRRLQYIHEEVSRLLAEYRPDAVAIEDQSGNQFAFVNGPAFCIKSGCVPPNTSGNPLIGQVSGAGAFGQ